MVEAARGYNSFIQELAAERGWAYVNLDVVYGALYAANANDANPTNDLVPTFPITPTPETPNPDAFGRFYSLDGIHPSAAMHRVMTNVVLGAINDTYGTTLQPIDAPAVPGVSHGGG